MQSEQFRVHHAAEQRHWWFVARRKILRGLLAAVLPPDPHTIVIDVGCGTGGNTQMLAEAYRGIGIDPSAEAIATAQDAFPQAEFLCGTAPADLGGLAGEADAYLLTDVLEHVEDDFLLLSKLLAAAKPGAFFLLTVPADLTLWSLHDVSHGHYRRYDRPRFCQLWEGLDVNPRLVSYYNARLYPVVKAVRSWNRRRGHSSGEADTDLKIPSRPVNWMLTQMFAGELKRLLRLLARPQAKPYRRGVSLIALLQRGSGEIVPRQKPPHVAADFFNPITGELVDERNAHPTATP